MWTRLTTWASRIGSGGLVLSGVVGAPVMVWLGPPLAMALAIWSGHTTEPTMPAARFPWILWAGGICLWGAGMALKSRPQGSIALLNVGGVLAAIAPWIHLWRLWGQTS